MYIIATFEHSLEIELLISELIEIGINKKSILALPLRKREEERKLFDSIHQADGISLFDGAFILGSIFMVLGVIYGFILEWGPIIWGLVGLMFGGVFGFIMDYYIGRFRKKPKKIFKTKLIPTEVVLIVKSSEEKIEIVEKMLWKRLALGVAIFK